MSRHGVLRRRAALVAGLALATVGLGGCAGSGLAGPAPVYDPALARTPEDAGGRAVAVDCSGGAGWEGCRRLTAPPPIGAGHYDRNGTFIPAPARASTGAP